MDTVVPFRERINGMTIKRHGYAVGDCLVVSWASTFERDKFKIFNSISGRPIIPNKFSSQDDAKEVARFLDECYKQYWEIAEIYPDLDIIAIARWSVKHGIRIHLALSSLQGADTIGLDDIRKQFASVEREAKEIERRFG